MHKSLYAVFAGLSSVEEDVCYHLSRLLGTRKGCLSSLPDYGVTDVLAIFRQPAFHQQQFCQEVAQQIACYEPRLQRVSVSLLAAEPYQHVCHLRIDAELITKSCQLTISYSQPYVAAVVLDAV